MTSYLDTSFLLKMYVRESESDDVADFVAERGDLLINSLTQVEVTSALFRNYPRADAVRYLIEFQDDVTKGLYRLVPITRRTYFVAADLCERFSGSSGLRSLDALHLATAIVHDVDEIATFDSRLAEASRAAGLTTTSTRS